MIRQILALAPVLPLLLAQAPYQKPSPFPEKNREREVRSSPASARGEAHRRDRTSPGTDDTRTAAAVEGTGKACFFSPRAGAVTASGAQIDPDEFVAAHASYPLGSRASVTNLANRKTVVVRIVDRFFDTRRVISVSEAAARQLGFLEAGTAAVSVEPVSEGAAREAR